MRTAGTRWFELSGRELRVLLAAACVVLLLLTALQVLRSVFWEQEVKLENVREALSSPHMLDLNSAKEYELTLLPGIGPKRAQAIINYRDSHGGFSRLEELAKVGGIGPKEIERLRPLVMCRPVLQER